MVAIVCRISKSAKPRADSPEDRVNTLDLDPQRSVKGSAPGETASNQKESAVIRSADNCPKSFRIAAPFQQSFCEAQKGLRVKFLGRTQHLPQVFRRTD